MRKIALLLSFLMLFSCSKVNEKGETVTTYGFSIKELQAEFGTPDSMRVCVIVDAKDTITNQLFTAADLDGTKLKFEVAAMQDAKVRVVYRIYVRGGAVGAGDQTFVSGETPSVPKPSLPSMAMAGSDLTVFRGRNVAFAGEVSARQTEATAFAWDFNGDGIFEHESSLNTGFSFVYDTVGVFPAVFRVTGSFGLVDLDTMLVTVTNPPVVIESFQVPSIAKQGALVELNVNAHKDFGTIMNYEWDIDGDGKWDTSGATLSFLAHSFSTSALHTVIIRVTDSDLNKVIDTATIDIRVNVVNVPPQIDGLFPSDSVVTVGDFVSWRLDYSDGDSRANVKKFEWDVNGDGVYEIVKTASSDKLHDSVGFIYPNIGVYSIRARITDSAGAQDSVVMKLRVIEGLPIASVSSATQIGTAGLDILFTITASDPNDNAPDGSIVKYLWDFNGDGVWDDSTNICTQNHAYPDLYPNHLYTVKARVRDDDGNTADALTLVQITNEAPKLGPLTPSNENPRFNQTILLTAPTITDAEQNQIDSLWWDLNADGIFETKLAASVSPRDSFPNSLGGSYTIRVIAKDRWGASDTSEVLVVAQANHAPNITQIHASTLIAHTNEVCKFWVNPEDVTDADGNQIDSITWQENGVSYSERHALKDTISLSYAFAYPHTIKATLYDSSGASSSKTIDFTVRRGFQDARDGQWYFTTVIGNVAWMAENLNYSGDLVSGTRTYTKGWCYGVGGTDTSEHQDAASCANGFGRLYNWAEAMDLGTIYLTQSAGLIGTPHQGICPSGWHLPDTTEEHQLITSIAVKTTGLAESFSGKYLKGIDSVHTSWNNTLYNAQDPLGYSLLPVGRRSSVGVWENLGFLAQSWTATEYHELPTIAHYLFQFGNATARPLSNGYKTLGASVRCIQN